jgi:hypothetical protein
MLSAGKTTDLSMALAGRFTGHHALLCRLRRDRIKVFDDPVAGLEDRITAKAAPWQREPGLLRTIPGFIAAAPRREPRFVSGDSRARCLWSSCRAV